MADAPYLVALALEEKGGERALPLTGKSQSAAAVAALDPGEDGRTLALELLLRLWQGSDALPLRRAAGDPSLLLVEMPLEVLVSRAWRITIARDEPLSFIAWP